MKGKEVTVSVVLPGEEDVLLGGDGLGLEFCSISIFNLSVSDIVFTGIGSVLGLGVF